MYNSIWTHLTSIWNKNKEWSGKKTLSITFHSLVSTTQNNKYSRYRYFVQRFEWFRAFLKTWKCVHLDKIPIFRKYLSEYHLSNSHYFDVWYNVTYCHVHNWQKIKNIYTVSALSEYHLFINITCASLSINKPFNQFIVEFFRCIYHYTLVLWLVGIFQRSNNIEGLLRCWDRSLLSANLLFSI